MKTREVKIIQAEFLNDLFCLFNFEVPTKQDRYAPITLVDENGQHINTPSELYAYNKNDAANFSNFKQQFIEYLNEHPDHKKEEWPRKDYLEVFVTVTTRPKRSKEVDIDNLCKGIIDCMKGIVFDDDIQILSLYATKGILSDKHSMKGSLVVGVRVMKNTTDRHLNFPLYSIEESEVESPLSRTSRP
jgi:Holliday junction resolvase RusA-like endonuclease